MTVFPIIPWLIALILALTSAAQPTPAPQLDTSWAITQVDQVVDDIQPPPSDELKVEYPCWDLQGDHVSTEMYGPAFPQGTPPGWHLLVLTDDGRVATASFSDLSENSAKPSLPDHPEC